MNAEQCARIWQMALLLGAEQVTDDQGAMLAELAGDSACAFCNRADIPKEMEQAVAMLLLELQEGCGSVSSVRRGDTAVTYKPAQSAAKAALRPFCRLGTVKEDTV